MGSGPGDRPLPTPTAFSGRHRDQVEPGGDLVDLHGALSGIHDQVKGSLVIDVGGVLVQVQKDDGG